MNADMHREKEILQSCQRELTQLKAEKSGLGLEIARLKGCETKLLEQERINRQIQEENEDIFAQIKIKNSQECQARQV